MKLITIILVGLVGVLTFVLVYMDEPDLTKGTVIAKAYTAESVYMQPVIINGKLSGLIPIFTPEHWSLKIRDAGKEDWIDVPQNVHNSVRVGEWYQ